MINLTDATEVQRYIRQLELALSDERTKRQKLEESLVKKRAYINFLDNFVANIGKKLGITRKGQEGLKDIDHAIEALLTRQ